MQDDRSRVVDRIHLAISGGSTRPARDADYAAIRRGYCQSGALGRDAAIALFLSRIEHYDGSVRRCARAGLPATIAEALSTRLKCRLVVAWGFPSDWLPNGFEFIEDEELTNAALEVADGVVTTCSTAIALTGTLVLTHADGEGRRALTLVSDYHLCIVPANRIVETVPEALRQIAALKPRVVTTISGPSATVDIEMTRIKGVHGPRTLDVIVVD